ncbi:MAG: ABC transporter permease [Ignavibacteriaceae bacterium]|nr:ABC transporter permease [Ignavibacteriaceae bacterium]
MKFEFFIALRYVFAKHKLNFITIISYLSLIGITLGTAALIIVLSVFNGFGSLVTSFLINFDPHIRIESKSEFSEDNQLRLKSIFEENGYKNYTGFVQGKVIVKQSDLIQVVNLKGISSSAISDVYNINSSIVLGDSSLGEDNFPKVLIGVLLADRLRATIGDTLTIASPSAIERGILTLSIPKFSKAIVNGIFASNSNEYDASFIFIDLLNGQSVLGYRNDIQGYEIKLSNISHTDKAKSVLNELLKEEFEISTWYDFHKELFSVMQIERWVAYMLLSLIIAVAVFNILGSLTMSVIEKKRDIGILISLGVDESSIKNIFMYQGLFIGIIGTISGFVLSFIVYFIHINYNIYPLDPLLYKINALPMELQFIDFITVGFSATTLSYLASILPSKKAAKINPVESIKWE